MILACNLYYPFGIFHSQVMVELSGSKIYKSEILTIKSLGLFTAQEVAKYGLTYHEKFGEQTEVELRKLLYIAYRKVMFLPQMSTHPWTIFPWSAISTCTAWLTLSNKSQSHQLRSVLSENLPRRGATLKICCDMCNTLDVLINSCSRNTYNFYLL